VQVLVNPGNDGNGDKAAAGCSPAFVEQEKGL